jgi:hypothetical protein
MVYNIDSYITLNTKDKNFILAPTKGTHQRQMFISNKLNPSLQSIKYANEETCNKNLCKDKN